MSDKLKLKGHMKAFMRWPLILSALLIVLNIWVYFVSVKAGIIVSGGILIYVGCAVIILRCHRPFIVNELIAFANQYDSLEKRILEELALPYAIMDMNGRMIWSNKVFAELTGKDQFYKKNVSTVFPDVTADKLPVADKKRLLRSVLDLERRLIVFPCRGCLLVKWLPKVSFWRIQTGMSA